MDSRCTLARAHPRYQYVATRGDSSGAAHPTRKRPQPNGRRRSPSPLAHEGGIRPSPTRQRVERSDGSDTSSDDGGEAATDAAVLGPHSYEPIGLATQARSVSLPAGLRREDVLDFDDDDSSLERCNEAVRRARLPERGVYPLPLTAGEHLAFTTMEAQSAFASMMDHAGDAYPFRDQLQRYLAHVRFRAVALGLVPPRRRRPSRRDSGDRPRPRLRHVTRAAPAASG